jgi:hypothetical protein
MTTTRIELALQRPAFDAVVAGGMVLLVLAMSAAWLVVIHRRGANHAWSALITLLIVVLLNVLGDQLGVFSRLDVLPPPFVLLVTACLGLAVAVGMGWLGGMGGMGGLGNTLVQTLSVKSLVALQIFRLPLELLMLRAALLGIMPIEFSLSGYNFDALTGAGALLLVIYCSVTSRVPLFAIALWNGLGIVCLIAIAALAALTSPNVHAFGAEARHINSWVLYFPYSLLPTLLVTYAVFGHVLLTRKLMIREQQRQH